MNICDVAGRRRIAILALIIASLIVISGTALFFLPNDTGTPSENQKPIWSLVGGDSYRTGRSDSQINANLSSIDWIKQHYYADCLTIANNGTIYLHGNETFSSLTALGPNGNASWTRDLQGKADGQIAIAPDGTILVLGGTYYGNYLTALDPSGTVRWQYNLSETFVYNPQLIVRSPSVSADGVIYLVIMGRDKQGDYNYSSFLMAIDGSGRKLWSTLLPADSISSPSLTNEGVVLTVRGGGIASYSFNGSAIWFRTPIANSELGPYITVGPDGAMYVPVFSENNDNTPEIAAINSDGTLRWACKVAPEGVYTFGGVYSPVALLPDGTIIVTVSAVHYKVHATDSGSYMMPSRIFGIAPNGTIRWENFLSDGLFYYDYTSPVVDKDGRVLVCSGTSLYQFNPNGSLEQRYDTTGGDKIHTVVIGKEGRVYCLVMGYQGGYSLIAFGKG